MEQSHFEIIQENYCPGGQRGRGQRLCVIPFGNPIWGMTVTDMRKISFSEALAGIDNLNGANPETHRVTCFVFNVFLSAREAARAVAHFSLLMPRALLLGESNFLRKGTIIFLMQNRQNTVWS